MPGAPGGPMHFIRYQKFTVMSGTGKGRWGSQGREWRVRGCKPPPVGSQCPLVECGQFLLSPSHELPDLLTFHERRWKSRFLCEISKYLPCCWGNAMAPIYSHTVIFTVTTCSWPGNLKLTASNPPFLLPCPSSTSIILL